MSKDIRTSKLDTDMFAKARADEKALRATDLYKAITSAGEERAYLEDRMIRCVEILDELSSADEYSNGQIAKAMKASGIDIASYRKDPQAELIRVVGAKYSTNPDMDSFGAFMEAMTGHLTTMLAHGTPALDMEEELSPIEFYKGYLGQEHEYKDSVLKLAKEGKLADHDGLLALLINKMDAGTYNSVLISGALDNLGPDALGFGLLAAVYKGDTFAIEAIMRCGRPINFDVRDREGNGNTPLSAALHEGTASTYAKNSAIMKMLIQHGADPYSAGLINEKYGKVVISEKVTDTSMRNVLLGYVALHEGTASTYAKNSAIMKMLIQQGADPYSAGLINEKYGKVVISEKVTDTGMRNVLLGYVALEQEFKEEFADRIIAGIKDRGVSFFNTGDDINKIIADVLKEDSLGKFANTVKQGVPAPKVELAFIDKFIISLQALFPDSWVESSLQKVKLQLNEAVQNLEAFKPLSAELAQELKTFASKVTPSQGDLAR